MAAESFFNVTKFKTSLAQGGARPSLFSVVFDYPTGITESPTKASFLTRAASIPASTIGSYDVHYHGKAIKIAGDRTFDTWDTTIFNDEDFGIRNSLENWMKAISNHSLNTRSNTIFGADNSAEGVGAKYKKDLKVKQYGKAGNDLRTYIIEGAWPSNLSAIALDWSTASEIEEFVCTWTYDSWRVAASADSDSTDSSDVTGLGTVEFTT